MKLILLPLLVFLGLAEGHDKNVVNTFEDCPVLGEKLKVFPIPPKCFSEKKDGCSFATADSNPVAFSVPGSYEEIPIASGCTTYVLSGRCHPWDKAYVTCRNFGGQLWRVESSYEHNIVKLAMAILKSKNHVWDHWWLGGRTVPGEQFPQWIPGSTSTGSSVSKWKKMDEQDLAEESRVEICGPDKWCVHDPKHRLKFVCEIVSKDPCKKFGEIEFETLEEKYRTPISDAKKAFEDKKQ